MGKHSKKDKRHKDKKKKESRSSRSRKRSVSSSSSFYSSSHLSLNSSSSSLTIKNNKSTEIDRIEENGKISTNLKTIEPKEQIETSQAIALKKSELKLTEMEIRTKLLNNENPFTQEVAIYQHFHRVDPKSIPNLYSKVVVYNLPPGINDDEVKLYFFTLLTTLNPHTMGSPVLSIEKRDDGYYYIFELATKDDIEIMLNANNTDWKGYRMKVQKPMNFFSNYNDTEGNNCRKREIKKNQNNTLDNDNKLYMGGIPLTATENDIRKIVESFGQIKTLNLVRDSTNPNLNRGFCFFEYEDPKVTEKAINGLNALDIMDKRLKVQRSAVNTNNNFVIMQNLKNNPVETTVEPGKSNFSDQTQNLIIEQIEIPLFATHPSRVIQMINVVCPEDVMDDLEYREMVEDIKTECLKFGTVLNVEIPRPDKVNKISGPAVGKIFVKFSTVQSAKKARFNITGKKYNRRTVVASFYPETYFDVREFNYMGL